MKKYDTNKAYNEKFFTRKDSNPSKFHLAISKFFNDNFDISYVIDWGCGTGTQLQSIKETFPTTKILGIESSIHSKPFLEKRINNNFIIYDLRHKIQLSRKATFSLSIEVAEHIEDEYAETFVKNITNNTLKSVFLTAAIPGQRGHKHYNCQYNQYWVELFEQNGFSYDSNKTIKFKNYKQTLNKKYKRDYFLTNTMIFGRT